MPKKQVQGSRYGEQQRCIEARIVDWGPRNLLMIEMVQGIGRLYLNRRGGRGHPPDDVEHMIEDYGTPIRILVQLLEKTCL
jgi:hypothetical protein